MKTYKDKLNGLYMVTCHSLGLFEAGRTEKYEYKDSGIS